MRLSTLALLLLAVAPPAVAQSPRTPIQKPLRTAVETWHEPDLIGVSLRSGTGLRVEQGELVPSGAAAPPASLAGIAGRWERAHHIADPDLERLRQRALARGALDVPDLALDLLLRLAPGSTRADSAAAIDALNALGEVVLAWPVARPVEPPQAPDFSHLQRYLEPSPTGIGAQRTLPLPGGPCYGTRICDIEYEFNAGHVDLPPIQIVGPPAATSPFGSHHATAVLGQLFALPDGAGITGGAYGAIPMHAAVFTHQSPAYNLPAALSNAIQALEFGDFILIEQQISGPGGDHVPSEWDPAVYNAVRLAVLSGINVVAAAGNGGRDLDDPAYNQMHAPFLAQNDSGAIVVGAGAAPGGSTSDRSRLSFSNYGSRVNLQGQGEDVVTTGYGALHNVFNEEYTDSFNGTSSASPVVTLAAAQVQSVYRSILGQPMWPRRLRATLVASGAPQTSGVHPATQSIGPRPDVSAALDAFERLRGCPQADPFQQQTAPWVGRRHAMLAYDARRARVVLFGGSDASLTLLGDTWVLQNGAWSLLPGTGPSPRADAAMAYDRRRDRMVLYGGRIAGGDAGDTWVLDGNTWSQQAVSGPGVMSDHAMAYDHVQEQVVLFASDGSATTTNTWQWNGAQWQGYGGSGPPKLRRAAMVYDPERERMVLFGGTRIGPADSGETWERAGTTWTLVSSSGPSPRFGAELVYDGGRRRSVLFGGALSAPFTKYGDLWEWDGVDWRERPQAQLPSARVYHRMVYHEAADTELVLGGDSVATIATRDLFLRARERQPGIPFCFGDGSGSACPCNNPSSAGDCRGCRNSTGNGSALRAHGVARYSSDTVRLEATGLPNGFGLYFAGPSYLAAGAGIPFGDGLRCLGGQIRRLGVRPSVNGTSFAPAPGAPLLSTFIVPGSAYGYQVWHRDNAAAGACTGAGFNLTNAVEILYAP